MAYQSRIKTAVFPVAGFGTRMLPATKTIPKEMLPVVDKPLIHYVVQEALQAGIERLVFVTGRNKSAIEDYFDHTPEQEAALEAKQKHEILESISDFPEAGNCVFVRQQQPLGLGHAVWCARHVIDGAFAVILPDVIMKDTEFLSRMIDIHHKHNCNVVALQEVPRSEVSKYGIVGHKPTADDYFKITTMVEKPAIEVAPSNMSILGRYVFTPAILPLLENAEKGAGGEIQLTDAMHKLLGVEPFQGIAYRGKIYDCGSREGFIEANIDMAYSSCPKLRSAIDNWVLNNIDMSTLYQTTKVA